MKEPCGREWGPAVQRAARSRLGPAEADGFLARLELLSFDILEPFNLIKSAPYVASSEESAACECERSSASLRICTSSL